MKFFRVLNLLFLFLSGFVAGIQANGLKYGLSAGGYEFGYEKLAIALLFAVMSMTKILIEEEHRE